MWAYRGNSLKEIPPVCHFIVRKQTTPPPPKKNEILSSACYGKKLEKITLCSIYACQHEMTLNSV